MNHRRRKAWKILLWKAYLDKGINLTSYIKYLIAFFGLASQDVKNTLIIAIIYAVFSIFLGRWWLKKRLMDVEQEINNYFNPSIEEIKQRLKHLSKNKKF